MDEERIREIVQEELQAAGVKRPSFGREQVFELIEQINQAGKDGKVVVVRPE